MPIYAEGSTSPSADPKAWLRELLQETGLSEDFLGEITSVVMEDRGGFIGLLTIGEITFDEMERRHSGELLQAITMDMLDQNKREFGPEIHAIRCFWVKNAQAQRFLRWYHSACLNLPEVLDAAVLADIDRVRVELMRADRGLVLTVLLN